MLLADRREQQRRKVELEQAKIKENATPAKPKAHEVTLDEAWDMEDSGPRRPGTSGDLVSQFYELRKDWRTVNGRSGPPWMPDVGASSAGNRTTAQVAYAQWGEAFYRNRQRPNTPAPRPPIWHQSEAPLPASSYQTFFGASRLMPPAQPIIKPPNNPAPYGFADAPKGFPRTTSMDAFMGRGIDGRRKPFKPRRNEPMWSSADVYGQPEMRSTAADSYKHMLPSRRREACLPAERGSAPYSSSDAPDRIPRSTSKDAFTHFGTDGRRTPIRPKDNGHGQDDAIHSKSGNDRSEENAT